MIRSSRFTRRVASALFFLALPLVAGITASGAGAPGPEGGGLCFTNLQGLGICAPDQFCPGAPGYCDAENPCDGGQVCVVGTTCPSTLDGVCLVVPFVDPGCSNPGTTSTGFDPCLSSVFFEDFIPVLSLEPEGEPPPDLHQFETTLICGNGSFLFENETCAGTIGAPTPRETARWGVALDCANYASAEHRVVATSVSIDISGCAGAVLDFDYLLSLDEIGEYDRAFVTVALDGGFREVIASNQEGTGMAFELAQQSCAGSILPVGGLIQDGAWHHFRAGVGSGDTVRVAFWGEVSDDFVNVGSGWFFDDVRIECGIPIHANGFEGGNLLRWSSTTAPPLQIQVSPGGSCATNYVKCGGPDSECYNFKLAGGGASCVTTVLHCGLPSCPGGTGDCPAGQLCVIDTCCVDPVCVPAGCDPGPY